MSSQRVQLSAGWGATSLVAQATRMVMVQLDVDANAAFAALRARAYQEDRGLQDVARDVIERRTRLDGPPK
jgi:AmiR/NasT family two-component response regulator